MSTRSHQKIWTYGSRKSIIQTESSEYCPKGEIVFIYRDVWLMCLLCDSMSTDYSYLGYRNQFQYNIYSLISICNIK